MKWNKFLLFALVAIITTVLTACGGDDNNSATEGGEKDSAKEVRIGYFPNMTHIATIIALEKGFFVEEN